MDFCLARTSLVLVDSSRDKEVQKGLLQQLAHVLACPINLLSLDWREETQNASVVRRSKERLSLLPRGEMLPASPRARPSPLGTASTRRVAEHRVHQGQGATPASGVKNVLEMEHSVKSS